MERFYPLHAKVCENCLLVQLEEFASGEEIFGGEYAYFSSYSDSWVQHARRYVAAMTERFGLGAASAVIEIASNYFQLDVIYMGIICIGLIALAMDSGLRVLAAHLVKWQDRINP